MLDIRSQEAVELFQRLAHNEPKLLEWLEARFNEEVQRLVSDTDDGRTRIAKGRAQAFQELMKLLKNSASAT